MTKKLERLDSIINSKRVWVAIDAANLESSVRDIGIKVDYVKLAKLFTNCSEIKKTFYTAKFQTASHNQFLSFLKNAGYKLVTKSLKTIVNRTDNSEHRKANFDVELALDALRASRNFDVLVLFSGDSDFDYLLKLLEKDGKKTVVISTKNHVSKELVEQANLYLDIRKIKDLIHR